MSLQQLIKYAPVAIFLLGLAYWLTLPSSTVAIDPHCEPEGIADEAAALLHPTSFWRSQLASLRDDRQTQERLLATANLGNAPETGANKIMTPIEKRMDRLSDRAAVEENEAEQKARLNRIEWETACENEIAARVEP